MTNGLKRVSNLERRPLSETVYERLLDQILDGRLAPETTLPSERNLAVQFGVNRNAVRESLKRLQQAGLLTVHQGGNSVVRDYLSDGGLELLPRLLIHTDGQVVPAVARAIFALRADLAPAIAAAAAVHADTGLAMRLEAVLGKLRSADTALPEAQELVLDYWRHLTSASNNIAYRLAFNAMHKTYRSVWHLLTPVLQQEFRDVENLTALAQAVQRGDTEAARVSAQRHVALGTAALQAVFAAGGDAT